MISQPWVEWVPTYRCRNQATLHARPWAIARFTRPAGRVAALTLLKWHRLFLPLRTGPRVAQQKPGAVTRPGFGTTLSDTVIAESRFTVKRDVKMKVRLGAWWLSQPRRRQYDGAPMRSRM